MLRKFFERWRQLGMSDSSVESGSLPTGSISPVEVPEHVQKSYGLKELDFSSIYPDLKRIARQRMRTERDDHTLQPTALINELYLQLLKRPDFVWTGRHHFLLYASQAMRHLLVDYAKKHQAAKRSSSSIRIDLGGIVDVIGLSNIDNMLDIDHALSELAQMEPRRARVVELRFFAGLSFQEIGEILGVTDRTAKRDWALAEEWLEHRLKGEGDGREGMG